MDDSQIVEGLKSTDEKGANIVLLYLKETFGPKILGIALKNSGNEQDADELLNTTLTIVWQNVQKGDYEEKGKFRQYIFSIAFKTWMLTLRTEKRKREKELKIAQQPIKVVKKKKKETDIVYIFFEVLQNSELPYMHQILKQLNDDCRSKLEAFHVQKLKTQEIAYQLKSADGYIRKRLHVCRAKLKTLLANLKNNSSEML